MGKGRVGGWSDGGRDDQIVRKENIGCAVILGIGGGGYLFPLIYGHSVWRSRVGAPYSTEYYFLLRVLVHVWASGRGKQVPSTLMEYEHHCVRSGIEYVHHVRCRGKQYCHVRYQYPYPSSDSSPNRPSSGDSTVFSHLSQASTSYPCLLGSLLNPPFVVQRYHTPRHAYTRPGLPPPQTRS